VRDDVQAIHRRDARAFAVGQSQAATDGLLDQRAGVGGAQRHDGVEVGHVPAFLEHVDVNHDLGRLVHALHGQQARDHLLFFRAGTAGIDLNHLALVAPLVEGFRLQKRQELPRVRGIARDDEHEGLDRFDAVLAGVGEQLDLGGLVQAHTVFQLGLLDLLGRVRLGVEVALGDHGRLLDEAILHRPRQRVFHHHVLERHRPAAGLDERRRRHFQTE